MHVGFTRGDPLQQGAKMDVHSFLPLSPKEFHILVALSEDPLNGYQIGQRVEETSRGAVQLSPATQYTNLHRLVEKALVAEAEVPGRTDGRGQRFWTLTPLGRRVLHAEAERLAADARLVKRLGPEG